MRKTNERNPMRTSHNTTQPEEEPPTNNRKKRGKGLRARLEAAISIRSSNGNPVPHLRGRATSQRPLAGRPHHPHTARRIRRTCRSNTQVMQHRQRKPHPTPETTTNTHRANQGWNTQTSSRHRNDRQQQCTRVGREDPHPVKKVAQTGSCDPGPMKGGTRTVWGL